MIGGGWTAYSSSGYSKNHSLTPFYSLIPKGTIGVLAYTPLDVNETDSTASLSDGIYRIMNITGTSIYFETGRMKDVSQEYPNVCKPYKIWGVKV